MKQTSHLPFRGLLLCVILIVFPALTAFGAFFQVNPTPRDSIIITASDGTNLYVDVRGQGPACLYIHGGPGVGSYWMEELYGSELERHFTMVYLDQRGSGRSASAATGDYSIERMAKDFEEVRQSLGIDSLVTFSHSFGGVLQMKHAELYPDHLKAMLMVAPTINLNESVEEMIGYALKILDIKGADQAPYLDKNKYPIDRFFPLFTKMREEKVFWKPYYADPRNSDRMDSVMAQVPSHNGEFGMRAFGMAEFYTNFKPATKDIAIPVLLYFGRHDYAVGPNHYKNIAFPNMTLHFWEGGHVPFMEGKQELEQTITEWLTMI